MANTTRSLLSGSTKGRLKLQPPSQPIATRRTTVALSVGAAEIVQRFQEATGISLSEAISELIERSEERPARIKYVDGMPTADVSEDGKWITNEDVLRAEAEIW